jgi:hypothetical protein
MDAVNEYIVAGIKEFDTGPSIMIAAKSLCNFGIVSFLVKKIVIKFHGFRARNHPLVVSG